MEDERIVALFLSRDEAAVAAAAEKYGEGLKAVARGLLGDEGEAEECVNDAWLEAWNRIPPHEPRDYLFPFLAKIVRAKALNRVRARSAEKRGGELVPLTEELAELLPGPGNTEGAAEAADLAASVNRWLRGVSAEKRRVFLRRYWYAASVREIAEACGMSEGKVKSLLWRARRELKRHLEKEGIL